MDLQGLYWKTIYTDIKSDEMSDRPLFFAIAPRASLEHLWHIFSYYTSLENSLVTQGWNFHLLLPTQDCFKIDSGRWAKVLPNTHFIRGWPKRLWTNSRKQSLFKSVLSAELEFYGCGQRPTFLFVEVWSKEHLEMVYQTIASFEFRKMTVAIQYRMPEQAMLDQKRELQEIHNALNKIIDGRLFLTFEHALQELWLQNNFENDRLELYPNDNHLIPDRSLHPHVKNIFYAQFRPANNTQDLLQNFLLSGHKLAEDSIIFTPIESGLRMTPESHPLMLLPTITSYSLYLDWLKKMDVIILPSTPEGLLFSDVYSSRLFFEALRGGVPLILSKGNLMEALSVQLREQGMISGEREEISDSLRELENVFQGKSLIAKRYGNDSNSWLPRLKEVIHG